MFEILCAVWNYDHFDGCDKIEQLGHVCTLTGSWEARGRAIKSGEMCDAGLWPPPLGDCRHSRALLSWGTAGGEMALAGCGGCSAGWLCVGGRTQSSAPKWQPVAEIVLICSL